MILSGFKQIFKLATRFPHAVLFILKCPGNGMFGFFSWAVKRFVFNLAQDSLLLFRWSKVWQSGQLFISIAGMPFEIFFNGEKCLV